MWCDSDVDRIRVVDAWRPLGVRVRECVYFMPRHMYLILVIHFCTSGAHRLFSHIDTAFFYSEYFNLNKTDHGKNVPEADLREAGLMSGSASFLGLFVPPLLGFLFTWCRRDNPVRLPTILMIISCWIGALGYFMLARLMNPILPLSMLSLVNSFTPTLLKVLVATAVPFESYATAYGMFEASESAVKTFGGVLVGIDRDTTGSYIDAVDMFGCLLLGASLFSILFLCFEKTMPNSRNPLDESVEIGAPLMSSDAAASGHTGAKGKREIDRLLF